eukprot:m.23396 g.23396  ORF g.23396 m.23396 type:complete len:617 (-) comp7494_c0_seq4:292-2142(-)
MSQFYIHTKPDLIPDRLVYTPPDLPCRMRLVHPKVNITIGPDTNSTKASIHTTDFVALERMTGKHGELRVRADSGQWLTEYTPRGNITIHCIPITQLPPRGRVPDENLLHYLNTPHLQRWVGVQYHPKTEIESHYGEMTMSKCYDLVVFVDKTKALRPLAAPVPVTNKRLFKEYHKILRDPIQNIEAHPMEENILEWHFLLTPAEEPYAGGQYHGILEFPAEYPMRPPAIKMLTPNGRFETNTRLCLSMSDYHPESWNPGWSVATVLVGLQSFMYEENNVSIGSISATVEERKKFAKESHTFNSKNTIFQELFGKTTEVTSGDSNEPVCRFCFVGENLIAPCECKGSNEFVHLECLRKWQKSVLLTQSTHPKYQTEIDKICGVCQTPFKVAMKSRHEAIVEYTGKQVIAMVKVGSLIVSSRESSESNLELIEKHPEIKKDLMHWTKSCFLILNATKGVVAINMSRQIPKPADYFLPPVAGVHVQHFNGGPCQPSSPLALAYVPNHDMHYLRARRCASAALPGFIQGNPDDVLTLCDEQYRETNMPTTLYIVWGYAGWGETQILAEIARGGWGMVEFSKYNAVRGDRQHCVYDFEQDFPWNRVVELACFAPKTEYSK